jgi:hypothetical protein
MQKMCGAVGVGMEAQEEQKDVQEEALKKKVVQGRTEGADVPKC